MSNHANDIEEYLEQICKNCEKANGCCIINEPYIGLCAKADREELVELYEKRRTK